MRCQAKGRGDRFAARLLPGGDLISLCRSGGDRDCSVNALRDVASGESLRVVHDGAFPDALKDAAGTAVVVEEQPPSRR